MSTTEYERTPHKYFCSVCGVQAPNKWNICPEHVGLTPAQREKERLRLRSNRPRLAEPGRDFGVARPQKACAQCGKPIRNVPDYLLDEVTLCSECGRAQPGLTPEDKREVWRVSNTFSIPPRDKDRAEKMFVERRKG